MSAVLLKILLVSQDFEDEQAVVEALGSAGFMLIMKRVQTLTEIADALDNDQWSLCLIDSLVTETAPDDIIALLSARKQETPYLVMFGSPVTAIEILNLAKAHNINKDLLVELGTMIVHEMNSAGERMRKRIDAEQGIIMLMDAWGRALELRDPGTQGHTQRVTLLALRLARRVGVPKKNLIGLQRGALLHDIGKLGIPDRILLKTGTLTDEENSIMRTHPGLAFNLLSPINYLQNVIDVPFCHHEKWDGTGYPRRLRGLEIPENARVFSICDVFDALTTTRPYREAWTKEQAMQYIKDESGKYFDPTITKVFIEMMEKENHDTTN